MKKHKELKGLVKGINQELQLEIDKFAGEQKLDTWAVAAIKARLSSYSFHVIESADNRSRFAAHICNSPIFQIAIPGMLYLKWHRGFKKALELLLNYRRSVGDLNCYEPQTPCKLNNGKLDIQFDSSRQVALIAVDGEVALEIRDVDNDTFENLRGTISEKVRLELPDEFDIPASARIKQLPLELPTKYKKVLETIGTNKEILLRIMSRWGLIQESWLFQDKTKYKESVDSDSEKNKDESSIYEDRDELLEKKIKGLSDSGKEVETHKIEMTREEYFQPDLSFFNSL